MLQDIQLSLNDEPKKMRKQKEKQNKRIKNLKSYSQDFYEVRQQAL